MSLFRLVKYSSILFFLGKYKLKIFRAVAVLLFAGVTSLLYGDIEAFLAREHPGVVIYALITKICIVYGALLFVLLQFKPALEDGRRDGKLENRLHPNDAEGDMAVDRLSQFSDLDDHDQLETRSQALLKKR